jgi:ATP-dependent Lon protease
MEIINLSGYTEREKLEIAKRFLVKKQIKAAGMKDSQLVLPDESLLEIIRKYTRESGVRNLEREIAKICRKIVRKLLTSKDQKDYTILPEQNPEYLGVPRYRSQGSNETNEVGLATGLAWTEVGGEVLLTETALTEGRGKLTLTGKLGEVMQESAQAALTFVRSKAAEYGIGRDFYRRMDLHIHIPEGAIPKDGPSAGITLATALVSALEMTWP